MPGHRRTRWALGRRAPGQRFGAWVLITLFIGDLLSPTIALAGNGPKQPEFSSFSPGTTSGLVDPFTGDFHYSIPLLDIDGYPIELFYNSGITMDQEASWVGLGWNLNAGSISRNLRGMPDDFSGDKVAYENYTKPSWTAGAKGGLGIELAGSPIPKISFGAGVSYNNYNGFDFSKSFGVEIAPIKAIGDRLTVGLTLESSTQNGMSVYPKLSLRAKKYQDHCSDTRDWAGTGSLGLSVGAGFSSRGGLQNVSISPSYSFSGHSYGKDASEATTSRSRNSSIGLGELSFDLGTPTYMPSVGNAYRNLSISLRVSGGAEFIVAHGSFFLQAMYARQEIRDRYSERPAYGFFRLQNTNNHIGDAVLDFNREKDGPYSKDVPALALAGLTYDVFSVMGHGVGGSYRSYRSDIGSIADGFSGSFGGDGSIGIELGGGNAVRGGGDIKVNTLDDGAGQWEGGFGNRAAQRFRFTYANELHEPAYFIEANEATLDPDPTRFDELGGTEARRIGLKKAGNFNVRTVDGKLFDAAGGSELPNESFWTPAESARRPRAKFFSPLTRGEMKALYGSTILNTRKFYAPDDARYNHHFGQLSVTDEQGKRFVYGIAAYNSKQTDATFATNSTTIGDLTTEQNVLDYLGTGTVWCDSDDPQADNNNGQDEYYQRTTIPPYAHSYLLTEVQSADYVDLTLDGPSPDDVGDYVALNYEKRAAAMHWRTPDLPEQARFSPGLLANGEDDKASFIYGEKELWYLNEIRTRDHVALFQTSAREDICSVVDEMGQPDTDVEHRARKLDRILLFTTAGYQDYLDDPATAVPEQTVYFEYDYSLCPGAANCDGAGGSTGKLTLKKVRITYGNSDLSAKSPYVFHYGGTAIDNPGYDPNSVDRWGGVKADQGSTLASTYNVSAYTSASSNVLPNALFPYVDDVKELADKYAQAWLLKAIDLPTGGRIEVDHEADEYAFVQNRTATKMFRLCDMGDGSVAPGSSICPSYSASLPTVKRLYFPYDPGCTDETKYASVGDMLYFKAYVNLQPGRGDYDHVPGYAKVVAVGEQDGNTGYVDLDFVHLADNGVGVPQYSPIFKTALQHVRMSYPDRAWDNANMGSDPSVGADLFWGLYDFMHEEMNDLLNGSLDPNTKLKNAGFCTSAIPQWSWIRLRDPDGHRMGGGTRVKEVRIYDRWDEMTDDVEKASFYGQHYTYDLDDGTSSGVAAYEPIVGGDENPFRQPVFWEDKQLLRPNDAAYQEEPFGEMFYPSPVVGYSRVTVEEISRSHVDPLDPNNQDNIHRHGTGKTVNEFYTAKDFPVFTDRTERESLPQKSPFSLGSIFKVDVKDHMTVSQGFSIETNAMHGRPMKTSIFQEGEEAAYQFTEYHYQKESHNGALRLKNDAVVVSTDGQKRDARIGMIYDGVVDMRESKSTSRSVGLQLNLDGFVIIIPLLVTPILPTYSKAEKQFRSASMTKVIQRFPLVDEVVQFENGSRITTKNLAYDAETGQVLLTSVQDHFDKPVYNMRFPAYWYYRGMGPAYRSEGYTAYGLVAGSNAMYLIDDASAIFHKGDELLVTPSGGGASVRLYTAAVAGDAVSLIDDAGQPFVADIASLKIVRTGRRNMTGLDMASITSLQNPLDIWGSDVFEDVLSASAVEFEERWRTNCECLDGSAADVNPFRHGLRGAWRPKRSFTYLTDRSFTRENGNTDIRKDGIYLDFSPYYQLESGAWVKKPKGWTFVDEVVEFDPLGHPIGTENAIGIPSASIYGYGGYHITSTAVNAQHSDIGFTGFEDQEPANCLDAHFRFEGGDWFDKGAHSGRYSMLVTPSSPSILERNLTDPCEPGCSLSIVSEEVEGTEVISTTGGDGVVTFEYEVLLGSPVVDLGLGQLMVTNPVGGSWSLLVTACDAAGCCQQQVIEHIKS